MSGIRQSSNSGNLLLVGAGVFCLLCGSVMISECATFASWFLGARLSFGVPLSEVERLKVLFVEVGGILACGEGVVLLAVGLLRLVRYGVPPNTAEPVGR